MASAPVWLLLLTALATTGCYDFTYEEPRADAAPPTGDGGTTVCVPDALYCGGDRLVGATDTVYRCAVDGGGVLLEKCASGCLRDAGARCAPPATPCKPPGLYCGGDKLDGDPGVLYRCVAGGTPTVVKQCARGCVVMPAGSDDACAP